MNEQTLTPLDYEIERLQAICYYNACCPFVHRVQLILEEKAVPYEQVVLEFEKLSSMRNQILHAADSSIIMHYINDRFTEPNLLPKDESKRSKAEWWMQFVNNKFLKKFYQLLVNKDNTLEDQLRSEMIQIMKELDDALKKNSEGRGPYFFGDEFSLVDISLIPWFVRWSVMEKHKNFHIPNDCERIKKWIEACRNRECVKKTICKESLLTQSFTDFINGKFKNF